MAKEKKYSGSCYIGVVGSDTEIGICRDSIENIERNKTDTGPFYVRATKGFEARQMHINKWYEETKHPFLLLLDHDMRFPADTLKRLRGHKLPYLSGFYMRRMIRPVAPVWYEYGKAGDMPMMPMTAAFEPNSLYRLGASGWGCILMHRDVITGVRKLLKGEPEVIEDDMDLYPYDLKKLIKARNIIIKSLQGEKITAKQAQTALETFVNEIRPLRAVKDTVGSDIRFPFYARLAGFDLWGDTGVQCEHMAQYPVAMNDWLGQPLWSMRDLALGIHADNRREQERLQKARNG